MYLKREIGDSRKNIQEIKKMFPPGLMKVKNPTAMIASSHAKITVFSKNPNVADNW
ncbi:MAG: hypothetical protein V3U20_01065 [Thermoplasmata archaeon]